MNKQELIDQLQGVFRDVLDLPGFILQEHMSAEDIEEWDSLTHINLISAIEKKYKIRFALGELDDMKTVGNLVDAILKKHTSA